MESRNFLLYAIDLSLIEDKINEILVNFPADTTIENRSIKDDGIGQILGELNTPTFLNSNKCIVIKDSEQIFKLSSDYYRYFINYLGNPASFSVLILVFSNINFPDFKDLKTLCVYYDLTAIKQSNEEYLRTMLEKQGYTISEVALSLLLTYGEDLTLLKNILQELMTYKITEKNITEADVNALLEPPLEDNVYELSNAVIQRDSLKAYLIYQDLEKNNISITYLIGLLLNKFQEMYNNNILIGAGYTQNDLAELYKVKLGRAYYMLQEAKNTSSKSLKRAISKLNDLEYGIKKGTLNPKVAFSTYLLSL